MYKAETYGTTTERAASVYQDENTFIHSMKL